MRSVFFFIIVGFPLSCLGQLTDEQIYDLKGGRIKNDTSYVYWLPYASGKRYLLIQASNSKMSHRSELSADFKMKTGEAICAAREGIVIDFRSDSDKGGLHEENLADGNFVKVQHDDGSIAKYWHLQKNGVEVNVGDKVQKGQVIGKSGNTGYTAFPHLHFQVVDKSGKQILPRFNTKKGIKYLRPGKWYRCVHVE